MRVNRELMKRYWAAAEAKDLDAMHQLRDEALVVDFPQTGERLSGRDVVRAFEEGHGADGSFELTRLTGEGEVWVAEGLMRSGEAVTYVVSITELRNGRVARSIDYFAGRLPSMLSAAPEEFSDE
jgi:ketosteroid isomerase-like protein